MEQKWGPQTKISSKELSFLFHSICLDALVILVYSFVKIGWKWPSNDHAKRVHQSGAGYFGS